MSSKVVRNRTRAQYIKNRKSAVPNITLPMLRTSERGTFKQCRWKWMLEFEEEIHPKTDMPALRFGSLIHKALAAYYIPGVKRGLHPAATFRKEYDAELEAIGDKFGQRVRSEAEDDEVWVEAGELGETMMNRYVERYGNDDEWEVLVTEQPFQILVRHPTTNQPWFRYVGVMDGVWKHLATKRIHIVDHKTARSIEFKYLAMDPQATAYWTFGLDWIYQQGLLRKTQKPSGMLFNIMRKAKDDDRPRNEEGHFLNKDGSVSLRQPPPYFARTPIYRDFNERERARRTVLQEFGDVEWVRGDLEKRAYKNPGQFTCPMCWAFDICELHEIGADYQEMKRQTTKEWEPYAPHEIYEGR